MFYLLSLILTVNLSFADSKTIYFGEEFKTCLSQQSIWDQFNRSLLDSQNSQLWPNSSSTVLGEGLKNNSVIDVTYISPLKSPTYSYYISDVTAPATFTYNALKTNHPFEGGAQITIEDFGSYRTLKWDGQYDTPESAWISRLFFQGFSKSFFRRLNKKIKAYEKISDCSLI